MLLNFTFDSSVLPLYRPRGGWCENVMLMFGNVEGTLRRQTGAGGWAGRLDGWMKLGERTFDVVFWNRGVAMGLR